MKKTEGLSPRGPSRNRKNKIYNGGVSRLGLMRECAITTQSSMYASLRTGEYPGEKVSWTNRFGVPCASVVKIDSACPLRFRTHGPTTKVKKRASARTSTAQTPECWAAAHFTYPQANRDTVDGKRPLRARAFSRREALQRQAASTSPHTAAFTTAGPKHELQRRAGRSAATATKDWRVEGCRVLPARCDGGGDGPAVGKGLGGGAAIIVTCGCA